MRLGTRLEAANSGYSPSVQSKLFGQKCHDCGYGKGKGIDNCVHAVPQLFHWSKCEVHMVTEYGQGLGIGN